MNQFEAVLADCDWPVWCWIETSDILLGWGGGYFFTLLCSEGLVKHKAPFSGVEDRLGWVFLPPLLQYLCGCRFLYFFLVHPRVARPSWPFRTGMRPLGPFPVAAQNVKRCTTPAVGWEGRRPDAFVWLAGAGQAVGACNDDRWAMLHLFPGS
ncbi:hypothetical protein BGX38DRAFT_628991 [Terfezia claveryi]|nr:hypothetical protein BGX38DRAFT_628991 [Terfezia claveryi]